MKENKQLGKWNEVYNDGSKYEREYENEMKHGYICFTWADVTKYTGHFE